MCARMLSLSGHSNNIGGMTSPISSPPNVIALNWCEQAGAGVSFGAWLSVTMPFCSLLLLASWAIIRLRYPPKLLRLQMSELTCKQPPMTRDQILALVVTTGTVRTAFSATIRLCVFVLPLCVCVFLYLDARGWLVDGFMYECKPA